MHCQGQFGKMKLMFKCRHYVMLIVEITNELAITLNILVFYTFTPPDFNELRKSASLVS